VVLPCSPIRVAIAELPHAGAGAGAGAVSGRAVQVRFRSARPLAGVLTSTCQDRKSWPPAGPPLFGRTRKL